MSNVRVWKERLPVFDTCHFHFCCLQPSAITLPEPEGLAGVSSETVGKRTWKVKFYSSARVGDAELPIENGHRLP